MPDEKIIAPYAEIEELAVFTVRDYLDNAVIEIDKRLGKDYAKNNPALVAAFIQACATNAAAYVVAKAQQGSLDNIAGKLDLGLSHLHGIAVALDDH